MQKTHIHFALSENEAIFLKDSLNNYHERIQEILQYEEDEEYTSALLSESQQLTELISSISATIEDGKDEDKYWD